MPNFKLVVCYDGSRYKGWQKQGNTENTIQARLEHALNGILGESIEISGSGRTDAGAHAKMQVASFRAATKMPPEEILKRLRGVLPEDIGAVSLDIHCVSPSRASTQGSPAWARPMSTACGTQAARMFSSASTCTRSLTRSTLH